MSCFAIQGFNKTRLADAEEADEARSERASSRVGVSFDDSTMAEGGRRTSLMDLMSEKMSQNRARIGSWSALKSIKDDSSDSDMFSN